jgi:hypothetical protein
MNFKDYLETLNEAAQQGFQYEKNAAEFLILHGIVPNGFTPAGAGSDIPDLIIQKNGAKTGCELKITAASAGSLVLKYDIDTKLWRLGDKKTAKDVEKKFIMDIAEEYGVLDKINKEWKNVPYKFSKDKSEIAGLDKRGVYAAEKARFVEINGEMSASHISDYYNKKNTYYVNVGTHGFYLLGKSNPLKIKGIPDFGSSAKAKYRARVQSKGGGNYQFTFEMSFSIAKKSPYNLAPTIGKSVEIADTDVSWFLA